MEHERPRQEMTRPRHGEHSAPEDVSRTSRGSAKTGRAPWRAVVRWFLGGLVALVILLVLVVGAIYVAGLAGVGGERLAGAAQEAIQKLSKVDVKTRLGGARLVFDRHNLVALEVRDVHIERADSGDTILDARFMRFGLNVKELWRGEVGLGSAKAVGARLAPADLNSHRAGAWDDAITDANGLIDPSLVSTVFYGALHRAFDIVASSGTRRVELADVELITGPDAPWKDFAISSLVIRSSPRRGITFGGEATLRGRRIVVDGEASRASDGQTVEALALTLTVPPRADEDSVREGDLREDGLVRSLGGLRVSITGSETENEAEDDLALEFHLDDLKIGVKPSDRITIDGRLKASISDNSRSVTISDANLSSGRSTFRFHGALGPIRDMAEKARPAYAFQLISDRSNVAPRQSPEPTLPLKASVAGRYEPSTRRAFADVIKVDTGTGSVLGSAGLTLEEGKSPGLTFAAAIANVPTSHMKQIWPWFAASGAREWVLDHVFGGQVADGEIQMSVPPGRLGNGIPLNADEVNGHFSVTDTRFDVAGSIPPVRDANGEMHFSGTDIRVDLSSGSVYMPSGRRVSSTGGTFVLKDAEVKPRIGRLEIDVAGKAPAVVELASYEPIAATRYFELAPDDVSGDVEGHISADIPLQDSTPAEDLSWKVALDYTGLSLAKPFDGQVVTDAEGSLVIQPGRADIKAKAKLNDIPASLDIVQPLGDSTVASRRDVVLTLDDAARDRLVPGLSTILTGNATARFEAMEDGRQKVTVDLANATLSLPWVGWKKGPGIPAEASFLLDIDENTIALDDFVLTGDPFSARGTVRLANDNLRSARFTSASLNRGDDFSLSLDAAGSGYAVTLNGAAVDARSVIKRFAPSATGAGGGAAAADASVPITLKVDVDRMNGFNGESLGNVDLSYSGTGGDVGSLTVDAVTTDGQKVTLRDGTEEGLRSVRMQSTNAGAVLRFLDIYEHMEGGSIGLALSGPADGPLAGQLDARNFWIVNEPRLSSLVSATPVENRAGEPEPGQVNSERAQFERGYAVIEKGDGYLKLANGALRGPLIGTTFQGTLYDPQGNIAMTGTFMPAYGVNRIFGEIPIIGQILGNGRDRGLIGVTYRLTGKAAEPKLEVNPISAIAPGIFRQIFEFR